MSWMWIPYFAGIVDGLKSFLIVFGLVLLFVTAAICFVHIIEYNKPFKHWKYVFWSIPIFLVAIAVPSKETIFQMAGFGAAETVVKSVTANKALELANEYLTKQLKQIKQENK